MDNFENTNKMNPALNDPKQCSTVINIKTNPKNNKSKREKKKLRKNRKNTEIFEKLKVEDETIIEVTDDPKNSLLKSFPWIIDFRKRSVSEMLDPQIDLITFYNRNVSKAVKSCYKLPRRAAKLKLEISNTLQFFHLTFKNIIKPVEHFSYLKNMSDLMAMYLDMEFKASRNGIESIRKIASMITSSLNLHFGNHNDYLLDSILKTNLISKRHSALGHLVLGRVLRDLPEMPVDTLTYIRFILVFKLWKEIMQEQKEKDIKMNIVKLACLKINPVIDFKDKVEPYKLLVNLFPDIPKGSRKVTRFLMKDRFSSRKKAKEFFKALENPVLMLLNCPLGLRGSSTNLLLKSKESEEMLLQNRKSVNKSITSSSKKNRNKKNKSKNLITPDFDVENATKLLTNDIKSEKNENNILFDDLKSQEDILTRDVKSEINNEDLVTKMNSIEIQSLSISKDDETINHTNHHSHCHQEELFHHERLCNYVDSFCDFFSQYQVDDQDWKFDIKEEDDAQAIKEEETDEKTEFFDPFECMRFEETPSSSNENFLFNAIEDVKEDDEPSSSLPLKKRRLILNKKTKKECPNTPEMSSSRFPSPSIESINEENEERRPFKTPAQLKSYQGFCNNAQPDIINVVLRSYNNSNHYDHGCYNGIQTRAIESSFLNLVKSSFQKD